MKARLNLTIEAELLETVKLFAASHNVSISEMVEAYFKKLERPANRKSILDAIRKLPPPKIDLPADLKKEYYESRREKYGT